MYRCIQYEARHAHSPFLKLFSGLSSKKVSSYEKGLEKNKGCEQTQKAQGKEFKCSFDFSMGCKSNTFGLFRFENSDGNVREVIKEHQLASGRPLYDWAEQKYPRIWGFIDGCKLRVKRSGNFNIQN